MASSRSGRFKRGGRKKRSVVEKRSHRSQEPKSSPLPSLNGVELSEPVVIRDLSVYGDGVGTIADGRTIFVPQTLPGEHVRVRINETRKRFVRGEVLSLEVKSPDRVEPSCRWFGECGGCHWQHIDVSSQPQWKAKLVKETLQRVGKVEVELPLCRPAPAGFGTRSRVRWQVSRDRKQLGFRRQRSHEMVDVDVCPVLVPGLEESMQPLRQGLPLLELPLVEVSLLASPDGKVVLGLHLEPSSQMPRRVMSKRLERWWAVHKMAHRAWAGVVLVRDQERILALGSEGVSVGEPAVFYRPDGFAQASFACNQGLVEEVLECIHPSGDVDVLELYSGSGNFSFALAREGAVVLSLEGNALAVEDGNRFARRAGLEWLTFRHFRDESSELRSLWKAFQRQRGVSPKQPPSWLLLDPPRNGVASTMLTQILEFGAPSILYVSCDPSSLARDIRVLSEGGYVVESVKAVDLMPQTAHVESVVVLRWQEEE